MNRERLIQCIYRFLMLVIPTMLIGYVTLRYLNFSYTALKMGVLSQAIYFSLGLGIAYVLYYFRARWAITLAILFAAYWAAGKVIARLPGEFDVFYTTARFELYATLFIGGWIFALMLVRLRYAYVIIAGIIIVITLIAVSDTVDLSIGYLMAHLAPVLIYALYMMFITPLLSQDVQLSRQQATRLALRLIGFLLLVIVAFAVTQIFFGGNLKAVEKELAARGAKDKDNKEQDPSDKGYDDRYGLMERRDDQFKLKDTMRINSRMSSSERLMFCARLDSYFPDGETPMPLYFVYHYLTQYDPKRESFVRDPQAPSLDEMDVDPAEIPLYATRVDSSVFRKSMAWKLRRSVNADVYLAANTWKHALLGPASVYSVQPIPVEKDFQKTFFSAYRVKAYFSELNNAYLVYNISANPFLEEFQQQRTDVLQTVMDYRSVPPDFVKYYTEYPEGRVYDSISALAKRISKGAITPIEKVNAVRDFFLERGPDGKRIFRYTLKPGAVDDPNIPSASMLYNFLFRSHAGYCTYYAGASLFMLRSLGIPARLTTGFATISRSDKNKGWYWFYASQAHAWTQVYFPEYGWMDFDMTIGNEDQQSAPRPDGTPPLPPPEPWLVLQAVADGSPDLTNKKLKVQAGKVIFDNHAATLKQPYSPEIDASLCRIVYNEKDTTLSAIHPGDSIIVISYKDEMKGNPRYRNDMSIERQVERFPQPITADEIHIQVKDKKKDLPKEEKQIAKKDEQPLTWKQIAVITGKSLLVLLVLILLMPVAYLLYRLLRIVLAGSASRRADMMYRAALYRLHMAGAERGGETPLSYAGKVIDPAFGVHFEEFMTVYLRLKYSGASMKSEDELVLKRFAGELGPAIRKTAGWKLLGNYLNPLLALRYFVNPPQEEYETQTL